MGCTVSTLYHTEFTMSKINFYVNYHKLQLNNVNYIFKFLSLEVWKSLPKYKFFKAYKKSTDSGVCCHIIPQLDFHSLETGNEPDRLTSSTGRVNNLTDIPLGASAGRINSLSFLLDAEIFEIHKDSSQGLTGFRFGLGHPKDVAYIGDYSSYISTGKYFKNM